MQRIIPENLSLSENALLKKLGFSKNLVWSWRSKCGEVWEAWYAEQFDQGTKRARDVLRFVGMNQAVQPGNFEYWKEMAILLGLIERPKRGRKKRA